MGHVSGEPQARLLEVLREVEEILSDATITYWTGDGVLDQIQKARDLIEQTLKSWEPLHV